MHATTCVGIAKYTNVMFAPRIIAIAAPQCARINCLEPVFERIEYVSHWANALRTMVDRPPHIVDDIGGVVVIFLWYFCRLRDQSFRQPHLRIEEVR